MTSQTTQRKIDHARRKLLGVGMAAAGAAIFALRSGDALAQQTPGVGDKEIRLGTWMPLTGPLAAYGVPLRAGIEAYLNMVNDRGGIQGRKLVLTVEDNAYNAQRTLSIARKLVTRDDVYAVIAPLGTAQTAAAFDYLLGEAKVPLINPYGGTVDWYVPPRENLYGVQAPYEGQARALGRWARKDGHKSLVVLHTALMGYDNVAGHVAPGAKSMRPDATVELFGTKFGTTDYGPIALEIIRKKPDAVVLIMAQGEVIAASKELRTQGYKGDLYTYSPSVSSSLLELGGTAVEGVKSVSWIVPVTTNNAAVQEYRDALAKYSPGEKPDYVSLTGFGMTKIVVEAIRRIEGPLTRQALIDALQSVRNYDSGIFPPVTYGPDKHMGGSIVQRVVVQGGKWVALGAPIEGEKDW